MRGWCVGLGLGSRSHERVGLFLARRGFRADVFLLCLLAGESGAEAMSSYEALSAERLGQSASERLRAAEEGRK